MHGNDTCPGALDPGPHLNQHRREIDYLRLPGSVLNNGLTLCQHRGHQDVFGTSHRNAVEGDARAFQSVVGYGLDVAERFRNLPYICVYNAADV